MAIKNVDGTPYRLHGPNPLMKKQHRWEIDGSLIIHNLDNLTYQMASNEKMHPEEIIEQAIEVKPEVEQEIKSEPIEHRPHNNISREKKPIAFCVPAIEETNFNVVTGEFESKVTYGDKFTFEVNVIEEDYLSCMLWGPLENISKNSIIFIHGERRWWKVIGTEAYNNGILINCMPSQVNPSFS